MGQHTDIIIAGGGIAGLTLGVLLGRGGFSVALIEPYPPAPLAETTPTGRTVALMESSLNIVKATGVWPAVEHHAGQMRAMRIIDDSMSEQIEADFYADDIDMEQFGFNVPNSALRAALYEIVQENKAITLHTSALTDMKTAGHTVHVTLESGDELRAPLLVGADGRKSAVRTLHGIDVREKRYNQSAMTCLIHHSRSHNNTSTEFHKPAGPLACVPLPGNRSSIVWVERPEKAEALLKLKKDEFTQALQEAMHSLLGGITLETGPECWPLGSIRALKLTAPRTALIAEAAHVMSPITAQGLNLSLRDVAALAETIVDSRRLGLDIGSTAVLAQYERRRSLDVKTRVIGVDTMNRAVSNDIGLVKGLRRFGLKTIDRIHPLKTFAMRRGLAPEADQGRLAKGEAL